MTNRAPGSSDHQTQFADALKRLMVRHGLGSVRPRGPSGFIGLTQEGKFDTRDLAFKFLSSEEHQAAAHALEMKPPRLEFAGAVKGRQDMEGFVREVGRLFDEYGVLNLEFTRGALLGFRKTGPTVDFVVEGITLTLR